MNRKTIVIAVLVCIALLLATSLFGCARDAAISEPTESGEDRQPEETVLETVIDATGREVFLESAPERIVSLMPSKTEKLFALGLGDKLVGVTDMCDYPEELGQMDLERVGDAFSLSAEAIIALDPDLVVANWLPEGLDQTLLDAGIAVFEYNPASVDDTMEGIRLLGRLTGRQEQAETVVAAMEEEFNAIVDAVKSVPEDERASVVYLLDNMLFVCGTGTLQDDLITMAGGINAVNEAGWPQLSEEVLLDIDPEVILYTFPEGEELLNRPGWQDLQAVKEGRFHKLDESLASRTSPRLPQSLQLIQSYLYPEL